MPGDDPRLRWDGLQVNRRVFVRDCGEGIIELVVKEDHERVLARITHAEFRALRNSMDTLAVEMCYRGTKKQ